MAIDKIIWDTLKAAGFNDYTIAAIMGNLYAESGLIPNNLQNNGNTNLKMTDEEYTTAVDTGKYAAVTFVNDKYGYGLAQWTYYSRKQNLLDYAKSLKVSIGDPAMQVKFIIKELAGYPALMNILKTATSVQQASDAFLADFERPAKLATAQLEQDRKNKRASYGMTYFNKYHTGTTTPTTTIQKFTPRTTAPSTTDKYWKHTSAGGVNECILISNGSCIPNCVGYAWGRFYEIIGKRPSLSRANAEDWYGYTTDGYRRSQTPALGAVICWAKGKVGVSSDGAGHVAIVEEIKSNGDIVTSNSGYNSTRFWMQTFTKASGYSMNGYTFQGFILPPDSTPVTTPSTSNPTTTSNSSLKVGDVVQFNGTTHYSSAGAVSGYTCKPGKAKITQLATGKAHPYHLIAVAGGGSNVYGWVSASDIASAGDGTKNSVNYMVKITTNNLNIRSGPGTNYPLAGSIKDQGCYTILEESTGQGASMWGKLKSGAGWISLDYAKKI